MNDNYNNNEKMTNLHIQRAFRISPEAAATFCNEKCQLGSTYILFQDELLYNFLMLLLSLVYLLKPTL